MNYLIDPLSDISPLGDCGCNCFLDFAGQKESVCGCNQKTPICKDDCKGNCPRLEVCNPVSGVKVSPQGI